MGLPGEKWAVALGPVLVAWGACECLALAYPSTDDATGSPTMPGDLADRPLDPLRHLDAGGGSDTGSPDADAAPADAEAGPGDSGSVDSAVADSGGDAPVGDSGAPVVDSGARADAASSGDGAPGRPGAGPVIEGGGCSCAFWQRTEASSTGLALGVLFGLSAAWARRRKR